MFKEAKEGHCGQYGCFPTFIHTHIPKCILLPEKVFLVAMLKIQMQILNTKSIIHHCCNWSKCMSFYYYNLFKLN